MLIGDYGQIETARINKNIINSDKQIPVQKQNTTHKLTHSSDSKNSKDL